MANAEKDVRDAQAALNGQKVKYELSKGHLRVAEKRRSDLEAREAAHKVSRYADAERAAVGT